MKTQLLKIGCFVFVLTMISFNKSWAFTATTNGDWSDAATWGGTAPSGNVSNQDIIIPSGIEVNMDIDVTFSGLLNNFTVDGSLTSTTNNQLSIQSGTFGGSGDIDIHRIAFSGLLTNYTHSGDLMVHTFVNTGAVLNIGSQMKVSDTLNLDGGTLTLATGSNLTIDTNAMIVRNDGSLATSGGVFSSGGGYHVQYVGGAKTTGIEINSLTLQDADISLDDNTTILTLGSNLMVNGNLQLNSGIVSVGANNLEIHGTMSQQPGTALTTVATSKVIIQTGGSLNSGLVFTSGSSVDQLTIDYTGSGNVKLSSPLAVAGELHLHDGTFSLESGSTLTMNAGSLVQVMSGTLESNGGTFVGTASYDVDYMADADVTTGEEITGSGLNDVEINMSGGTVMMDDDMTVGGELTMTNGKLDLNSNNLILNGTFYQAAGSPIIGDENSDIQLNVTSAVNDTIKFDGADQNLEQLIVNITGGGDLVLASMLHIHDELTLTSGSLMLQNDNLVIEQNADITGYSDTRYIMTPSYGKLQMYVPLSSPYMVFPVGTTTNYSPASIQLTSGDEGNFMVKAFEGVFTGGTQYSGYNSANTTSVVNRTWMLETDAAPLNMNLKLGWMAASEVNGFDRTNAYITHYTNSSWDTGSGSNSSSGMYSTYEIDRTGITSLSPFAVIDEDAELIVDEETALVDLNIYPNPCTDVMNIEYANLEGNQYKYEVTDIAGRIYDVVNTETNQMDVSSLSRGTYLLRMTNVATHKMAVKQFIKK